MPGLNRTPASTHAIARKSCWHILALSLALSACQSRHADAAMSAPPIAEMASSLPGATPSTAELSTSRDAAAPAGQYASSSTTGNTERALLLEQENDAHRPDDSYNQANLRAQYKTCTAASDGLTPAIQACMDEELHWQDQRLQNAWGVIADGPDSEYKDKLADEQAAYMRDTNRYCRFDPSTQNQGQIRDAQSCRINRYANRADVLQALIGR